VRSVAGAANARDSACIRVSQVLHAQTKALQNGCGVLKGNTNPEETIDARAVQLNAREFDGRTVRAHGSRSNFPACELAEEIPSSIKNRFRGAVVGAALEAMTRLRVHPLTTRRTAHPLRIEVGALEQHILSTRSDL